MSDALQPHERCRPRNSPGQNTGEGSLSLLQGIFPTQGSNPGLPHCSTLERIPLGRRSHAAPGWGPLETAPRTQAPPRRKGNAQELTGSPLPRADPTHTRTGYMQPPFLELSSSKARNVSSIRWACRRSLMNVCRVSQWMKPKNKKSESSSVVSDSWWPHRPYSPWNSPGPNTGEGSLSLLQGIFPTQGSNPGLLHCRRILYQLSHQSRPLYMGGVFRFAVNQKQL